MRKLLPVLVALALLWPGAALQGQWYGWDDECQATLPGEVSGITEICASVQVRTVDPHPGTTTLIARAKNLSPVYWGGPIGAIFSLPGVEDPPGFIGWYDDDWYGEPNPWWFPFFHQPSYMGGWAYYSLHLPFGMKETDLVGFFGEAYGIEDYEAGAAVTNFMRFNDPAYVVPEPAPLFLVASAVLGIAFVAWRRNGRRRAGGVEHRGSA